jgi:hypothetical protein
MTRPRLLDLKGGTVLLDETDWPLVEPLTVYVGTNGYAYFSVWKDGRSWPTTLHSFLMGGARPGQHIDHRNGNKLDNRRHNLRFVSYQQNGVNRHRLNRNNTSGLRGVAFHPELSQSNPWHAQITVNRRNHYLGLFATQEAAVAARRQAELELYGELCP